MSDLNVEGMALADGVLETIISIAVQEVEGVARVGGASATGGLFSSRKAKPATRGIEVSTDENDDIAVSVRIEVVFGQVLPEVAQAVRTAVANAVLTQVGAHVSSVDVYIDGIRFE